MGSIDWWRKDEPIVMVEVHNSTPRRTVAEDLLPARPAAHADGARRCRLDVRPDRRRVRAGCRDIS